MKALSKPSRIPKTPTFVEVDDNELWSVPGYKRRLPHWRLEGATYFVTFRLADSIPRAVAQRWKEEREQWLASHEIQASWEATDHERFIMAIKSIASDERAHFQRQQSRHWFQELDRCHGCCILQEAHSIVASSLEYFHGTRLWLGDYVIMPNQVHVIAQPFPGVELEEWLYSVKRFSATQILKAHADNALACKGHLWQVESFDRVIRDVDELAHTKAYIANNPAKLKPDTFAYKSMDWLDRFAPI